MRIAQQRFESTNLIIDKSWWVRLWVFNSNTRHLKWDVWVLKGQFSKLMSIPWYIIKRFLYLAALILICTIFFYLLQGCIFWHLDCRHFCQLQERSFKSIKLSEDLEFIVVCEFKSYVIEFKLFYILVFSCSSLVKNLFYLFWFWKINIKFNFF
jgi:hypothetical protein